LRVRLCDVVPKVVRVIDVPAASTLSELHELLQAGIGWTDSHLHQFVAGDVRYGVPHEDSWDEAELDESGARLKDLPASFTYLYDFGDGWTHDVEIIGSGGIEPGCPSGHGACPPEDCGGPPGYEDLLRVLAEPADEEHEQMRAWAGDLPPFDQPATDGQVRRTVGQVPAAVRLVLDLARGGVKLTPGGRLPRSVVRQVQEHRPGWYPLGLPASVEEDLMPLAVLHDLLRQVGLLRLHGGVLHPTKAASDDLQTVRRLRSTFESGQFDTIVATTAIATLAAHGAHRPDHLATRLLPQIGHGWAKNGRAITEQDVHIELRRLTPALQALDQITTDTLAHTWGAGPSARTLLTRATALAALWE
jgi:hypothetical protein